mmetsp:Transcript_40763/g.66101  ORF Transcript_40763/g.66101 Transcript_40763/m.66101 type:complete len:278 (+) Transcript_40763:56-889(+)
MLPAYVSVCLSSAQIVSEQIVHKDRLLYACVASHVANHRNDKCTFRSSPRLGLSSFIHGGRQHKLVSYGVFPAVVSVKMQLLANASSQVDEVMSDVVPIAEPELPKAVEPRAPPTYLESGTLPTDRGIDYSNLRENLARGEFFEADVETRRILCELGGEISIKRKALYFSQYTTLPTSDLHTIDYLWTTYSSGKFGFAVQHAIWMECQQDMDRFLNKLGWKEGGGIENIYKFKKWPSGFKYSLDAPSGHLPLTNHIRGSLGHLALLQHPAWLVPRDE